MKDRILDLYNKYKVLKEEYQGLTKRKELLKNQELAVNVRLQYIRDFSEGFQNLNIEWYAKHREISSMEDEIIELLGGKIIKLPNGAFLIPIETEENCFIKEFEELI